MYKVMIVDDEILVRIGLRAMIDWEKIGFQITDEAGNGESAYEKFLVSRPDVIMTDIKMPQKDGLWLIEKVKAERPETEVVILTAYDDFDYARKALKLNASEYLLKAEMEEQEVERVMLVLKEKLDKARENMAAESQGEDSQDTEKQERLLGLMLNEYKPLDLVKEQFQELYIPWNTYQCCFFQFDFQEAMEEKDYGSDQVASIISACRQLILARFQSRYKYCFMKQFGKSITALLMDEELQQKNLNQDVEELQKSVQQYFGIQFKSANSGIETEIGRVRKNGTWIFQISEQLFYRNVGEHIVQRSEKEKKNCLPENSLNGGIYTETQVVRLGECLMNTDEDGIGKILEEIRESSIRSALAPLDLKLKLVQLINSVARICHSYVQEKSEELLSLQKKLLQAGDLGGVFQVLQLSMDCMMDSIVKATVGNAEQLIEKSKAWVEIHYGERISLEEVARVIGISQYYFSHLFRKSQGIKFSAYLNEVRIRHAREMLRDPKVTVAQVYEMVGFNDQSYFSKTFKRITGMTITEYRERFSAGSSEN